jgi:hypothetical protein
MAGALAAVRLAIPVGRVTGLLAAVVSLSIGAADVVAQAAYDEADVQLRMRRAATLLVASEEEVRRLERAIEDARRGSPRDAGAIDQLTDSLAAARKRMADRQGAMQGLQKEREAGRKTTPAEPPAPAELNEAMVRTTGNADGAWVGTYDCANQFGASLHLVVRDGRTVAKANDRFSLLIQGSEVTFLRDTGAGKASLTGSFAGNRIEARGHELRGSRNCSVVLTRTSVVPEPPAPPAKEAGPTSGRLDGLWSGTYACPSFGLSLGLSIRGGIGTVRIRGSAYADEISVRVGADSVRFTRRSGGKEVVLTGRASASEIRAQGNEEQGQRSCLAVLNRTSP